MLSSDSAASFEQLTSKVELMRCLAGGLTVDVQSALCFSECSQAAKQQVDDPKGVAKVDAFKKDLQ